MAEINDKIEADMVDQKDAPASVAPDAPAIAAMNMIQALNSALDVKMAEDPTVVSYGEDAGYFGGVFRVTDHLQKKHGLTRSFDAPISETGIVGTAIGMAAYGLRPVVEIQFADYIYPAYDQIVSEAAKMRYRSGGQFTTPMVVRSPYGGGIFGGQTHSQSPESLFTHIAGLKVVIPSNPYDAKGLLTAAIEDDDPVIFFEPKRLYNGPFDGWHEKPVSPWKAQELAQVPTGKYIEPIGKARVMREGNDVTILAYGTMVWVALAGAEHAGVDAEVIDLRSLVPLDREHVIASVKKTGRLIVIDEDYHSFGVSGEIIASVVEHDIGMLKARPQRVAFPDIPIPFTPVMEQWALPNADKIVAAYHAMHKE